MMQALSKNYNFATAAKFTNRNSMNLAEICMGNIIKTITKNFIFEA